MNDRAYDTDLLDTLSKRVMVGDGAMGTQLQAADLTLDDFNNLEGCNEILNDTRPDVIETIHRNYFEAGADAVETNTFGCNLSNLGDYDIADRIRDLSQRGTAIARRVADEMSTPDRRRYVLGSMGPGTKLPTLGHTEYAVIRDAYTEAALGMLEGGADAILVETCQDLLQLKAAVLGSRRAMAQFGRHIPVIAHVTVETTGTMLLGSEIGAALTAVEPLGVDMIGLNCATGPAEMSEHLRYLSQHARTPVSVMPNAGLPVLGANGAEYPLQPDELAEALSGFVTDYGLSLVGGCCGTTPEHIRRVAEAVPGVQRARAPHHLRARGGVAVLVDAVRAGRIGADDRRADERQRLQGVPRGDARRGLAEVPRHRQGADPRRCAPARPVRRLCRPRRCRRHERAGQPARHCVDAADHAGLHRNPGAARRVWSTSVAGARSTR